MKFQFLFNIFTINKAYDYINVFAFGKELIQIYHMTDI